MHEYDEAIADYAKTLRDFIEQHELPSEWFTKPDHIAIKCADGLDYDYRMQELMPDGQQAYEAEMDKRRLGSMHLIVPITVGNMGQVSWLEIMEPRPEKVGKDVVGLEHMEFYYPDFESVSEVLKEKKIDHEMQSNKGHAWVNIKLNEAGQELKLNNKLLADTVMQELENGITRQLLA